MTDGPVDEGTQNVRPAQAEPGTRAEPDTGAERAEPDPRADAVPEAGPGGETSEETLKRWEASPGA